MTDASPNTDPTNQTDPKPPERSFTQADMDAAINERLKDERKKHAAELAKFADYEDLQAKAAKLDELEAANKSEMEKLAEAAAQAAKRAEEAEAKAAKLEAKAAHDALVAQVASDEGVPADMVHGADEDEMRASAQAFKAHLEAAKPKNPDPKAGGATPKPDNEYELSDAEMRAFGLL